MCSIFGIVAKHTIAGNTFTFLNSLMEKSVNRGRDGWGVYGIGFNTFSYRRENNTFSKLDVPDLIGVRVLIGNMRAEPTTEYVEHKSPTDQQPYELGDWVIVHNGTIANDTELRTHKLDTKIDSAAIAEVLDSLQGSPESVFSQCIHVLKGSYAIAALHKQSGRLFVACNYRPIWYVVTTEGTFFASSRSYFPDYVFPKMLPAYSIGELAPNGLLWKSGLLSCVLKRAIVVCSGGLDSVVAATYAKKVLGLEIELLHFQYGCIAQYPEVTAIANVAKELDVPYTLLPIPIYGKSDSPLLNSDSTITEEQTGAEFAHEWVPARNLVMLSIATAYAEAKGFDTIILGNNLEEAGAYPDNEPEFIDRFNDILPFAVGVNKKIEVKMPVGNKMKHEIVKLGHAIGAPMHLTWSCYKSGDKHCGKCGPCFMRRKAFEMNNLTDPMEYM